VWYSSLGLGLENYRRGREEAGLCGSVIGPWATGSDGSDV
jgi:hypothetical protein